MVSNSNDIPANADFCCYVINLDGSTERFSQVSVALEKAGVAFERLSAFDGRKLPSIRLPIMMPRLPDAIWGASWSVAKSAAITVT